MVTEKLKELVAARAKVEQLEQSIMAERNQELAALPAQFGFPNVASFIAAVRAATGKRRGRRPKGASAATPKAPSKRRKRAKITDATRAEVKKLVEAGRTGPEIAKAVGISLPSVQNVKAALGMIKKRK